MALLFRTIWVQLSVMLAVAIEKSLDHEISDEELLPCASTAEERNTFKQGVNGNSRHASDHLWT
jgi:hypothetical protein